MLLYKPRYAPLPESIDIDVRTLNIQSVAPNGNSQRLVVIGKFPDHPVSEIILLDTEENVLRLAARSDIYQNSETPLSVSSEGSWIGSNSTTAQNTLTSTVIRGAYTQPELIQNNNNNTSTQFMSFARESGFAVSYSWRTVGTTTHTHLNFFRRTGDWVRTQVLSIAQQNARQVIMSPDGQSVALCSVQFGVVMYMNSGGYAQTNSMSLPAGRYVLSASFLSNSELLVIYASSVTTDIQIQKYVKNAQGTAWQKDVTYTVDPGTSTVLHRFAINGDIIFRVAATVVKYKFNDGYGIPRTVPLGALNSAPYSIVSQVADNQAVGAEDYLVLRTGSVGAFSYYVYYLNFDTGLPDLVSRSREY